MADLPEVQLLYMTGPSGYLARLGRGGWYEAHGWTIDEALTALAELIRADPPAEVPADALSDVAATVEWLRGRAPAEATLDE